MPPRKKKDDKKKEPENQNPSINLPNTKEGLKREVLKLKERLQDYRRTRNNYYKERNQFAEFNTIVREEVVRTESSIRNVEALMEDMQDEHRKHMKMYLQKVINLEYQHSNIVTDVEKKSFQAKGQDEQAHNIQKQTLRKEKLRLKSEIEESNDFTLKAPVPLNTVCFRYEPEGVEENNLAPLNRAIMETINKSGKLFFMQTVLNGQFTLRLAFGNTNLKHQHVENAWSLIQNTAKAELAKII